MPLRIAITASRGELPPVKASQIPETAGKTSCLLEIVGDRVCKLEILGNLGPKKPDKLGVFNDKWDLEVSVEEL